MRTRFLPPWILLSLSLGGCVLANMTPQARFSEAAYTLNDASRWGAVDTAIQHVSPRYMERFTDRHRDWGDLVNVADADITRMQLAPDHKSATSEVNLRWYDDGGVTVRSTVVSQKWETEHGKFKLVDEAVRRGDPSVFAAPQSGGEKAKGS